MPLRRRLGNAKTYPTFRQRIEQSLDMQHATSYHVSMSRQPAYTWSGVLPMPPFRTLESCGHRHGSLEAADTCCAQVGRESGHRVLSAASPISQARCRMPRHAQMQRAWP